MTPRAIVFDLDETLAESKQPVTPQMAGLLAQLLERMPVAVTSGQKLELVRKHTLDRLADGSRRDRFYLLPTCGAALFEHREGALHTVYEERLSEPEVAHLREMIRRGAESTGLIDFSLPAYGERIEHRVSSVALSALGQEAPLPEKLAWDPDQEKRKRIRDAIELLLPDHEVKRAGSTSIDVTRRGLTKAYGVRKLSEHLDIPISNMLYIGDALFPGGNDEVVKETSIETRATSSPEETARIIEEVLLQFPRI